MRRTVASRLREWQEQIVADVIGQIAAAIPAYVDLDPELREDQALTVALAVRSFIACLGDGRLPTTEEVSMFGAAGMRRADQGFDRGALMEALSLGIDAGWPYVIRAATECGVGRNDRRGINALSELSRFADGFLAAVRLAMLSGLDTPDPDGGRATRRQALTRLLSGPEPAAATDRTTPVREFVGPSLHRVILVAPPPHRQGGAGCPTDLARRLACSLVTATEIPLSTPITQHATVVCHGAGEDLDAAIGSLCGDHLTVVGEPVSGVRALHRSYRRLVDLLSSMQGTLAPGAVIGPREARTRHLLQLVPADQRRLYVEETLGALIALGGRARPLLAVIEQCASTGPDWSMTAVAIRLHIERRTLTYRMSRIRQLTGLSLSNPVELTQLVVAHELLTIEAAATVPAD